MSTLRWEGAEGFLLLQLFLWYGRDMQIIAVLAALCMVPLLIEGLLIGGAFLRANRKDRRRSEAFEALMPSDAVDYARVQLLLHETKGLSALVQEAAARLRKLFPTGTALRLEHVEPYSGQDDHARVFLKVQTPLPGSVASRLLDQFDEWWISRSSKAGGKLSVCLDFV